MNKQKNLKYAGNTTYWRGGYKMKTLYKKLLDSINLLAQDLREGLPEDYRKLYRNIRAIQSYLEKKIR